MKHIIRLLILGLIISSCNTNRLKDGVYHLEVLTTNDIHGHWFDSTYVDKHTQKSIFAINYCVDSIRNSIGEKNTLLLDAGDCLQGENAAYYFNYIDTNSVHLFSRLVDYMNYDAIAVGNHDIETGHAVYDRVSKELKERNIAFLAANAIRTDNGSSYFPPYTILNKQGLKIAVIGYTNPNIKAWLTEDIWSGMDFSSITDIVQKNVNEVKEKENPDLCIILMHSGTGEGDGKNLESQGLDILKSIKGVDLLVCSHDHRPFVMSCDSIALVNSGSHCRYLGKADINIEVKNNKIVSKKVKASLIPIDKDKVDIRMRDYFHPDYLKVKAFTLQKVGMLDVNLLSRESYKGMSPYINLIHTLSLTGSGADISFAAPLSFNETIKAGELCYNDLFKIYPFENKLFILELSGKEIKDYLEYSYDTWINTLPSKYLLKIVKRKDERYGSNGYSFINRSYNFDSAGGLNYTVDINKNYGKRISIHSLANGQAFKLENKYKVAMTSYRASGGGDLLIKGAGIKKDAIDSRIIDRKDEIREILYRFIIKNKVINNENISNKGLIGSWKFIPQKEAERYLNKDMQLMFENK